MDVHSIPFPNDSFDVIFCNHVLEHVEDDLLACSEFNRVLKPGGWGILQSPVYPLEKTLEDKTITDPAERERLFGQRDHVRKFGKDYAERLRKSGLKIEENQFAKEIGSDLIKKHALPKDEVIFVCRKGS
jgi:ubiquinone/menaquinone biosynthesis C-methylase UbiE